MPPPNITHRAGAGEMAVQAVVLQLLHQSSVLARDWSRAVLPGRPSIIMSRLNSLARTTSVRSSRPRCSRSRISWAIGPVDLASSCRVDGGVAVLVRVPVQEGDVLGRHLDEARARPRSAAGPAGSPGRTGRCCSWSKLSFGSLRQVEGVALRRVEQAVGVLDRAQHRLLLIVAGQLADRAAA